ncbi:MAG: PAS domain-containing protein [Spirochaetales bacterium]|nr:PAS domain-containing protein [Spirochaetales bacterium]
MLENAESAILNEVLGSLPGIFYMFDKTGRFVQWNRQFVQVSGYSDAEMLERHPLDFFQGDDRELIASRIAQTFEHGEADAQAHFISKNGAGRPYFFTGRRLYQQEEVYLLGVGFDLSRVQTAETERRRYHELLMAALNQSLSAILIARAPDGRIELANPAALAMRGGRSEDLTGIAIEEHSQRWQTFRPDGSPFPPEELPLSRAILKGETSKAEEVIVRDQGGKDHIVVANASPVRDADGSTIAGIVVFHDVTQEREALREVERANEELLAINRVLLRAVTATTHKGVFDAALKELTDLTGMDGGLVCLKEGEVFAVVASRGEVPCEHSRDCPMLCCKENRSVPLPLFLRSTAAIEEQKRGPGKRCPHVFVFLRRSHSTKSRRIRSPLPVLVSIRHGQRPLRATLRTHGRTTGDVPRQPATQAERCRTSKSTGKSCGRTHS